MNNKEFIAEMSKRLEIPSTTCSDWTAALLTEMTTQLTDDNVVAIQGFGVFEVKKRLERVVMNPVTRQNMLVPPKLVLSFKPSAILKDKLK